MELVRVLPSAEDEVNVACFHPFAGGGLVYGTKVCFCWGDQCGMLSFTFFNRESFACGCRKESLGSFSMMVLML